jgi:hypothetical protein
MARNRRGIEEGISVQLHREAVDSTVDPAVTLPANDFAGAVGGIYALANSGMSESRSPADLCRRVLHHLIPGKRLEIRRLEKGIGDPLLQRNFFRRQGDLSACGLEGSTRLEVVFRGCGFTACGMNASCTNKTLL